MVCRKDTHLGTSEALRHFALRVWEWELRDRWSFRKMTKAILPAKKRKPRSEAHAEMLFRICWRSFLLLRELEDREEMLRRCVREKFLREKIKITFHVSLLLYFSSIYWMQRSRCEDKLRWTPHIVLLILKPSKCHLTVDTINAVFCCQNPEKRYFCQLRWF